MSKESQHKKAPVKPALDAVVGSTPELPHAINNLNPDGRTFKIAGIRQESFNGPLPHPDILRGYDEIKDGFAERILVMAEKEQDHRHSEDDKMIKSASSESMRGQWFAFIITVMFLAAAVLLGLRGHDWLAGVLGSGTLGSLVTIFVIGRKGPDEKHEAKRS